MYDFLLEVQQNLPFVIIQLSANSFPILKLELLDNKLTCFYDTRIVTKVKHTYVSQDHMFEDIVPQINTL